VAQLVDIKKDFDLGNNFLLKFAESLASKLDDSYRVIVKYDIHNCTFTADKKNVVLSLSNELHAGPRYLDDENVFMFCHNYAPLDQWGYPVDHPKILPLPLGVFFDYDKQVELTPLRDREYDFCFLGSFPHTGTRDKFKRCLDDLVENTGDKFKYFIKYTGGFGQGINHDEYMEVVNNTKICLCPQGSTSNETFRFFEAITLGALPMVEMLPKFWYYENSPCTFAKWQFLSTHLTRMLSFIDQSSERVEQNLEQYRNTVLTPDWLAEYFKHKIETKN